MNKICVMCPTRDRPDAALKMARSLLATSANADLVFYVDGDQEFFYFEVLRDLTPDLFRMGRSGPEDVLVSGSRVKILYGDRIGSVHSANRITHYYREPYTIYGMVPDDSEFLTPGWDRCLLSLLDHEVPHVVAAAHDKGSAVNFPFVNRAWIEAVGWYYYPKNHHHCCDTIVELIGECAGAITYASEQQMLMHHEALPSLSPDKVEGDLMGLLNWLVGERKEVVQRVKERIRCTELLT